MKPSAFNSSIFETLELDSNLLRPALHLVAQVQPAGMYKGVITNPDGTSKNFSLAVTPSPGQPSVNIDVSAKWTTDPTFSVVENGYVVISVLSGDGGQTIRIFSDKSILIDNKHIRRDQLLVMRILRPGKHLVKDVEGGASCTVTVSYPRPKGKMESKPLDLYVQPKSGASGTEFSVSSATVSVIQPVIVHLLDNSHITTELQFVTDREGDRIETTRVQKKVPGR